MENYKVIELEENKLIYYFIKSGQIFVASEEMDQKSINVLQKENIKETERTKEKSDSYALNFMSARTCNMGCKYCFAGEGEYEENIKKPKIMETDMYLKAYEWVMKINKKNISTISFFGGEPLIGFKQFKPAIEKLAEICKKENRPFPQIAISTNAVLFNDEILSFLIKYNVKIGLSVDGPQYINDIGRISKNNTINKKSAYQYTAEMAKKLKENGLVYTIQCTLNQEHVKRYKPGIVKKWIADMGELAQCDMVFVPVTTDLKDLKVNDYKILRRIAKELVEFYVEE